MIFSCDNHLCIYNRKLKCIRNEVYLDEIGKCLSYRQVYIDPDMLEDVKEKYADEYYNPVDSEE